MGPPVGNVRDRAILRRLRKWSRGDSRRNAREEGLSDRPWRRRRMVRVSSCLLVVLLALVFLLRARGRAPSGVPEPAVIEGVQRIGDFSLADVHGVVHTAREWSD